MTTGVTAAKTGPAARDATVGARCTCPHPRACSKSHRQWQRHSCLCARVSLASCRQFTFPKTARQECLAVSPVQCPRSKLRSLGGQFMIHSQSAQSSEIRVPTRAAKPRRPNAPWRLLIVAVALLVAGLCATPTARAQQYNPNLYAGMRWRQPTVNSAASRRWWMAPTCRRQKACAPPTPIIART